MSATGREQFQVGDVVNGYRWNGSTWEALPAHAMTDHMARQSVENNVAPRRSWWRRKAEPERIPARPFGRVGTPAPEPPPPSSDSKRWIWITMGLTVLIALTGFAVVALMQPTSEPAGTSVTVGQVEYEVLAAEDITERLTAHPVFPQNEAPGRYISVQLKVSSNRPGVSTFSCRDFVLELEDGRSATCRSVAAGDLGFVPTVFEIQTGQSQVFTMYYGIDEQAVIKGVRVSNSVGRSDLVLLKV